MEPRYENYGCEKCVFLRRYRKADLWFCKTGVPGGTLMIRNSSEGGDYLTVPVKLGELIAQIPEARAALKEAVKRNLL